MLFTSISFPQVERKIYKNIKNGPDSRAYMCKVHVSIQVQGSLSLHTRAHRARGLYLCFQSHNEIHCTLKVDKCYFLRYLLNITTQTEQIKESVKNVNKWKTTIFRHIQRPHRTCTKKMNEKLLSSRTYNEKKQQVLIVMQHQKGHHLHLDSICPARYRIWFFSSSRTGD